MEDGRLGTLSRETLSSELDAVFFSLPEGAVSEPVESKIGFHLLWCEKIHRARALPFSKPRPRVKQLLEERSARNCQKAWIGERQRVRASGSRKIGVRL
jgi:peptidyl-prolyl cis-trans isomerase C